MNEYFSFVPLVPPSFYIRKKVIYNKSFRQCNILMVNVKPAIHNLLHWLTLETWYRKLTARANQMIWAENKNQCEFVSSHMLLLEERETCLFPTCCRTSCVLLDCVGQWVSRTKSKAQNLQELPSVAVFFTVVNTNFYGNMLIAFCCFNTKYIQLNPHLSNFTNSEFTHSMMTKYLCF